MTTLRISAWDSDVEDDDPPSYDETRWMKPLLDGDDVTTRSRRKFQRHETTQSKRGRDRPDEMTDIWKQVTLYKEQL